METVVFVVAAVDRASAAPSAWSSQRNPVHSALSWSATLFGIAVLFVAQDAHFLAAVQVIVYAGAIVVLFLFVIMLLGVDQAEDLAIEPLGGQRRPPSSPASLGRRACSPVARSSATGSSATGAATVAGRPSASTRPQRRPSSAESLFTDYLFAFEITSVLLVIAVVGAVVLARKPQAAPRSTPTSPSSSRRRRRADAEEAAVVIARRRRSPAPATWSLGAMLFAIGAVGLLVRRNPLVMFMCVELMLNAVNLTFVTFARDARRRRRPGRRVLRARGGRRRGRGRPRDHRGHPPRSPGATADDLSVLKG